ncbi:MAG: hypothetical protein KAJ07_10450 [Planctomycetes bacterium]|nr:hypothetical protein [Planctomycetota bacterium]
MRKYLFLICLCVISVNAFALYWDDGAAPDNLWSNALNWDPDQVPTASDDVEIYGWYSGGNPSVEIDAVTTAQFYKKCIIANGSTVTVNGGSLLASVPADPNFAWEREINVGVGFSTGNGTLNLNGGTVETFAFNIARAAGAAVGLVEMTDGYMDVADLSIASDAQNQGTLNISDGLIEASWRLRLNGNSNADATAVVNITGGEIAVAQALEFGSAGTAVINITDGMLSMTGDKRAHIQGFIDNGNIVFFDSAPNADYSLIFDDVDTILTAYIFDDATLVSSITENFNAFHIDPNALPSPIYGADDSIEQPLVLASGYTWGGYADPDDGSWPGNMIWPKIYMQTLNPGVVGEENILSIASGARNTGSYVYTVFSTNGNRNATEYVPDLDMGTVSVDIMQNGDPLDLRLIIRDADDNWYVSSVAFAAVSGEVSLSTDVASLTWKAANTGAAADMDQLDSPDGPGTLFDPLEPDADPNLAKVTGGGLYLDNVTDPFVSNVRLRSIAWTGYVEPVETVSLSLNFDGLETADLIYEDDFNIPAETPINLPDNNFPVGGYANPDGMPAGWNAIQTQILYDNPSGPNLSALAVVGGARKDGAYLYTIFSDIGTGMPTQYVPNFDSGYVTLSGVSVHNATATLDLRLMVRNGDGNWYLSEQTVADDISSTSASTLPAIDVSTLKWETIDAASRDNMNEMAADDGPGSLIMSGDPNIAPDLSMVTGMGLYLDDVAYPQIGFLRIQGIDVAGYVPPTESLAIYEDFDSASHPGGAIYKMYQGTATPVDTEQTAVNTSGFRYGGWGDSTITAPGTYYLWSGAAFQTWPTFSRLTLSGNMADAGSYFYTIFSESGSPLPTKYVPNMANGTVSLTVEIKDGPVALDTFGADLRIILRNGSGEWFVSSIAFDDLPDDAVSAVTVDVSALTWKRVNASAELDMNQLDGGDSGPGILFDPLDPDVVPDLSVCTGGGVYIEDSASSPDLQDGFLRFYNIQWSGYTPPATVSNVHQDFTAGSGLVYHATNQAETPNISSSLGYPWGGWTPHVPDAGWLGLYFGNSSLEFYNQDNRGTYAYSIFSSTGNYNPTEMVDELIAIEVEFALMAAGYLYDYRFLIRSEFGDWYISSIPAELDDVSTGTPWTTFTVDVSDLTWYQVNQAAEDDMNEMDGDTGPGAITIGAVATPSMNNITGGGLHVDVDAAGLQAIRLRDMTWHGLPAVCGDFGTVLPAGADLNNDCYDDINDLVIMAADWVTTYQLDEFAILVSEWLNCTEPTDINCAPYLP